MRSFPFKYAALILIAFLLIGENCTAQNFDPFEGKSSQYQLDLSRYFTTPKEELDTLNVLLDSVKKFENNTAWDLPVLAVRLDQYEHFLVELTRHILYERLLYYDNKNDTAARKRMNYDNNVASELRATVNLALTQKELSTLTEAEINQFHLDKFRYLIATIQSNTNHMLPVAGTKIINDLAGTVLDRLDDRYDALMDDINKNLVFDSIGKKFTPGTGIAAIRHNKNAYIRETGAKAYLDAYAQHEEVFAATLIDIANEENALARLYNYPDAPARMYDKRLQVSEDSVKGMLNELNRHADVLKTYQQVQAEQIKHVTGLQQIHSWDMDLPLNYTPRPQTFVSARKSILQALQPLGKDYVSHFADLLDPTQGKLDITGGKSRVTDFTGLGYPGVPITLYMKSFSGETGSIRVLIHEGGHSIHRLLMSENHIVPTNSSGPNFLFESFAILNEFLLLDELTNSSRSSDSKAFYTKTFIDDLADQLFTCAEEGTFEQGIYDGVSAGKIKNQKDIDSLYAGIMNKYDLFFNDETERHAEWINKRLIYDDPIYNVNYLYASLVACKLYELLHKDPENFAIHYNALLRNGFNASADDLLQKFMGFRMDETQMVEGATGLMRKKTTELKLLYNQPK
jgi:oligoendopeptidase F